VAPVPRSAELSCAAVSALVTLGGPLRVNLDRLGLLGDVRFTPDSDLTADIAGGPKSAKAGHLVTNRIIEPWLELRSVKLDN
jgi:hypothetical protein